MEDYRTNFQNATGAHKRARRALTAWGMWLRAGLIGVTALVAGPVLAYNGEVDALPAFALVLGGAILAALAWSRLRGAMTDADALVAAPKAAVPATGRLAARGRALHHAAAFGIE